MAASGRRFPSTATSISRAFTARSTRIFCANCAASSSAAGKSAARRTLVMPTDEPSVAGFTNTGKRNLRATAFFTASGFACHSARMTTRHSTTGIRASRNRRFCTSLSMPTAEASTPEPTYGTPASSSSPCTVPSSPNVPCSTGNITSIREGGPAGDSPTPISEPALGSGGSITRCPRLSTSGSSFCVFSPTSQRPSLVMPMGTASYFSGSSARSTDCAEAIETSCSPERPPKSTPTRMRLAFIAVLLEDFLSQTGEDQLDSERGRLVMLVNHRVDFHHFERHHRFRIRNHFHGQVRLAISDAAAHGSAHARSVRGIDEIEIQAHRDSVGLILRKAQRFGHHLAHAALVQVAHGEHVHARFFDDFPLPRVYVAHSHNRNVVGIYHGLRARKLRQIVRAVAGDRGQRHAVNIPRRRR